MKKLPWKQWSGDLISWSKSNVTALVIAAISIGLAIYFYQESREERDPVFVVDPNRVEILSAERVATAPILVLRRDGGPVQGDIYAVRFYLWNAGKRSIKSENVLDTIRIALDSGSEILDFRVLKVSRPITHARVVRDYPVATKGRVLAELFSILEKDDGISAQIIYEGRSSTSLTVSGIVEGAASIRTPQRVSYWTRLRLHWSTIVLSSIGIGLILPVLGGLVAIPGWLFKRRPIPWRWMLVAGSQMTLLWFGACFLLLWSGGFNASADTVVTLVPPQLLH